MTAAPAMITSLRQTIVAKTRSSKNLLRSSTDAHRLDAAWDLLHAVADLHPELIAELRNVGGNNPARVREWTQRNKISCPAVDAAAQQLADGLLEPPETVTEVVVMGQDLEP